MKSGTTSLYHYIKTHPDVFMPRFKEPNFFIKQNLRQKDINAYHDLFANAKRAKAIGEASVNYTKFPHYAGVPEKISDADKNMKLIYVLRNPYERTHSHYLHNIYAGIESDAFAEAVQKSPLYIQASLYYMQIQEYLKYFSKSQMLILILDDLKSKPLETIQSVFRFLAVDEAFMPPNIGEVKHRTKKKRGQDRPILSMIKNLSLYHGVNNAIPDWMRMLAGLLLKKKIEIPPYLPSELPQKEKNMIASDLNRLSEMLNRDLSSWTSG